MANIYAVKIGRSPGIYYTWKECQKNVIGYPNAKFKKFEDEISANNWMNQTVQMSEDSVIAYVDGSFDSKNKVYSYGCVIIHNNDSCKQEINISGRDNKKEYVSMRNVAGELLGAVQAIEWALKHNVKEINIHHDYAGIGCWANDEWKTNLDATIEYKEFVKKARKKMVINFIKVPAHSGVELNEKADMLAKNALRKNTNMTEEGVI